MFPDGDNVVLGYPGATNAFNVIDGHITHHLPSHIAHCAIPAQRQPCSRQSRLYTTYFLTKTQSRNTAVPFPELKVWTLRTGKIGTRPKSSAARERHWTTPVDPNRYNTMSFKFSTRLLGWSADQLHLTLRNLTFSIFHPSPSGLLRQDRPFRLGLPECPRIHYLPRT